ncbi:Ribosome assembly protein 1 [Smittium mucronatum]|uniref:Elongation factor-like 1 n=1 Tax=Smittium mucronatum TaxID=133383 RepID=A0A1R0GY23_9FUNG|nr:Ribosome assembly protein 1 [Smittium mucronatum]
MATVSISKISKLQQCSDNIRNVCVLAHVDHGKTTLTDSLLSTNGIISSRLAGKVRFLDSRKDEQERGITMESSGISLYYKIPDGYSFLKDLVPKNSSPSSLPTNEIQKSKSSTEPSNAITTNPSSDEKNDSKTPNQTPNSKSDEKFPPIPSSEYLINLIDSPGHIDFGSEVSSAARLSDGALVLVDAIEGVCTQTISVLRQAWIEKVSSILVINKIDRLIIDLRMTPAEAYIHIQHLIQAVNAVLAGFWESDRIEESDKRVFEKTPEPNNDISNALGNMTISAENWLLEEKDDSNIYYAPEAGNVIFASAADGWAFTLDEFAIIFAEKMGMGSPQKLKQALWGDFYLDPKTKKRIFTKKQMIKQYGESAILPTTSNYQPLFVQLCLTSIWKVYEAVIISTDQTRIDKIIQTIGAKISPNDRKVKDYKALLAIIMRSWLPIAHTCMLSIVKLLPSPKQAQPIRVPNLLKGKYNYKSGNIVDSILNCSPDPEIASVAYISKMVAVKRQSLPEFTFKSDRLKLTAEEMRARGRPSPINKPSPISPSQSISQDSAPSNISPAINENKDEYLVGFGRLFCGTLSIGQKAFLLNPSYKPKKPNSKNMNSVEIAGLYILMGSELLPTKAVYPGCIFGIRGKDDFSISAGTLTTNLNKCPNLTIIHSQSAPIVRVAIEPKNPADIQKLSTGLSLLLKSDSSVRVEHSSTTGEYVLITAGELHLERCLKDLVERFAKCELQVSEPQVPFRETIVRAPGNPNALISVYGPGYVASKANAQTPELNPDKSELNKALASSGFGLNTNDPGNERGYILASTPNKLASIGLSVEPLPEKLTDFLNRNKQNLRNIYIKSCNSGPKPSDESIKNDQPADNTTTNSQPAADEAENNTEINIADSNKNGSGNSDMDNFDSDSYEGSDSDDEPSDAERLADPKDSFKQDINLSLYSSIINYFKQDKYWESRSRNMTDDQFWSFGPNHVGPNILLKSRNSNIYIDDKSVPLVPSIKSDASDPSTSDIKDSLADDSVNEDSAHSPAFSSQKDIEQAILTGFQLATRSGPLCAEQVIGLGVTIHSIRINSSTNGVETPVPLTKLQFSMLVGQIISTVRDAIREAMLSWSPRLLLAMYEVQINVLSEMLGKMYGVISKLHGVVVGEEMREGTPYFFVTAKLPVVESFGFADELRKRTSGSAQPLLIYKGFETLDIDPFWVPSTEEELEDLGEFADKENQARIYMEQVRKRKGLFVEKKMVERAEKQRTLKK